MNSVNLLASVLPRRTSASVFIEHMLREELPKLGLERTLFSIINRKQCSEFQCMNGLSQHQIDVYQTYQEHDVYLKTYLKKNLTNRIVYLQRMVPARYISDELFREILMPMMNNSHSYSGLYKMEGGYIMVLSAHSQRELLPSEYTRLNEIWKVLCYWADNWQTQHKLEKCWGSYLHDFGGKMVIEQLSDAEYQVFVLLIKGYNGTEISELREVSKETVRTQIKHILSKLGARHQNQLISDYLGSNPSFYW
ncbi:helix-turn-helix transcriptional regulator [Vibrio cholerae]